MLNSSVLVLNRSYLPVHVTTVRRAFSLFYQGCALAVNRSYETFDFDSWRALPTEDCPPKERVGTPSGAIRLPRVIVLLSFDRVPKRHVRYSRLNIFARDKFTCQYCGEKPHRSQLNLDHVIPRSLGGRTTWENVVCSCVDCNRRKGGRTPTQARLRLLRQPSRPRWTPVLHPVSTVRYDEWRPFLHIVSERNEGYRRAAGADCVGANDSDESPGGEMTANRGQTAGMAEPAAPTASGARDGPAAVRRPRLVPFGGGKGGVGKTFVAANLAATLARAGYRVVAVDGDLEAANLHTALGVPRPRTSVAEFVAQREEDMRKLLEPTPIENLRLISAVRPNLGAPQPSHSRRIAMIRSLRQLDADFVFIDLGAGTDPAVMDYFMVCDDGVVVIAPEPTSVENAYAFMRAAFFRRLRLSLVDPEARKLVGVAMDGRNERGIRTPLDLLREVEAIDPTEGARFSAVMRTFRPRIVVNDVRSAHDIKLGFSVRSVCRRYYAIEAEYLGYINHEESATKSVRACVPLVELEPRSDAAVYFARIARKLLAGRPGAEGARP